MRDGLFGLAAALALGLGVAAGGRFVGDGFVAARLGDRFVTVKGLSERDVRADLALWPLRFVATGDDLGRVQDKIAADGEAVARFLTGQGFGADEFAVQSLQVTDVLAQPYRSGPVESRFIIAQLVMVRSTDVDRVAAASRRTSELVRAGVVLSSDMGPTNPAYLFTRLNDLKPEMIAEATARAREGAAEFAADSGSRVGGIRQASQGVFQILARDQAPGISEHEQIDKTVRVVSTIDYYLTD
ncbi:MAG TPA: SIMPL domain-containing protein [Geminicoccaceae bacterium]|nr:SIMPL domain-containing protein [Geminicoccaceae bacterium]